MTKNDSPAMGAGFEPDDRVVYKTAGETQLWMDFFTPKSRESPAPLPAIVLFHGGGWEVSHTDQFHPQCHYFASRGIPAIAAEYRVSEKHGTSPFESVADAKSAIRWIRSNAAGLGVDPRRIVAGGGSSGGHVAAAAAMLAGFDEDGEDLSISVKPNALVLFNPVIDNGPDGYGHERVEPHWKEFSPMHNITGGVPPTIVFQGTDDPHVPISTVIEFKKRMNDAHTRCDLWTYNGQPHGFFHYRDGKNAYYNATVYEADRFLTSLSYLTGMPTLQHEAIEATFS